MAKWLIDPGHGGADSGAIYKGRRECDDVLKLALRVGELLKIIMKMFIIRGLQILL